MEEKEMMKVLNEAALKAVKNPKFKRVLFKDVNKAIKDEFKKEIPIKVTFHDSDEKHLVFVLPSDSQEMDDDALESVSGGVKTNSNELSSPPLVAYGVFPQGLNQSVIL